MGTVVRTRTRKGTAPVVAVLGVALLALVSCRANGDRPGMIFMPGMQKSVPYDAYDPNPVLPGGQTLENPPDGTVAMGAMAFAYGPGPQEAARAGRELRNPVEPTEANLARGKKVFETICIACHGPKGEGDGSVIGAGRFPNPPSLVAPRAKGLADGQIFHVITRGQGIMPSHAAQVLPEDRWRVILHVRTLQGAKPGAVPAPAATVAAAAATSAAAIAIPALKGVQP